MLTTYIVLSYVVGLIIAVGVCATQEYERKESCIVAAGFWFLSPLAFPLIVLTALAAVSIGLIYLAAVGLFVVGATLFTLPMAYLADKVAYLWKTFWEEPNLHVIRGNLD